MITLTSYQTTTILPNPEWSDSEQLTGEVFIKRSVDGQMYTYIKSKNDRRRLIFRLRLTRSKSLELKVFNNSYYGSRICLVDHENQRWIGNLLNNPFEFEALLDEEQIIQLEYEGIKQGELPMIDISSDTNLAVIAPIVLTDDTLSLDQSGIDHGSIGGLIGDDHTIYLLADGSRNLTGNLAVNAFVTIDGRDISIDGTKLDGIEALADKTDTANVTAAGAAMASGVFHDGFSDFVAAEHIVLPNTITNVLSDHNLAAHTTLGLFDQHADVDHNQTTNYDANKHVDHTGVSITGGSGLSGGGDISTNRTLDLDINSLIGEAAIAATDTISFYDVTASANRKITFSEFEIALNLTDKYVGIDAGATPGYLGVASNDGVLRSSTGLSYTDGGDFVTLALSHLGIESLADAGADKILFWDDGGSATGWLAVTGTGKGIVTTNLEINSGYVDRGDPGAWDYQIGAPHLVVDGTWRDLDLGPGGAGIIPDGTYAVDLLVYLIASSAAKAIYFRKKGYTAGYNTPAVISQVANISNEVPCIVTCDANETIQYNISVGVTTCAFIVKGWWI